MPQGLSKGVFDNVRHGVVIGHLWLSSRGLLKKSAPANAGEKQGFNYVENREVMLTNGEKVQ